MKVASAQEIRKTLLNMEPREITDVVMRMLRYKKDNKELASYLLYNSSDEQAFVDEITEEINASFAELKYEGAYKYTKQIRKIIRLANKPIRYSGLPSTQVEVLLCILENLKPILSGKHGSNVLSGIYMRQVDIVAKAMDKLHEDIRYDYVKQFERLRN